MLFSYYKPIPITMYTTKLLFQVPLSTRDYMIYIPTYIIRQLFKYITKTTQQQNN